MLYVIKIICFGVQKYYKKARNRRNKLIDINNISTKSCHFNRMKTFFLQ